MEYSDYVRECQKRQREYILEQQKKMAKLRAALIRYEAAAAALGLHPLTRNEIQDRTRQLEGMAATVEETHGDSVAMRCAYEARYTREPSL
jgi:hypothetical protein